MTKFIELLKNQPAGMCKARADLCDSSRVLYKDWELDEVSHYIESTGFTEFEFVGEGSNAFVVAPLDNDQIVIRISSFPGDHRGKFPSMLQPIGKPLRIATFEEDGNIYGGYRVEFLKKLDMQVDREPLINFLQQQQKMGYRIQSLSRGSEIGWYEYKNAATRGITRVLMGADPSALGKGSQLEGLPRARDYPSLEEQYRENLKIAKADERLSFLIPEIDKQIQAVPVCRVYSDFLGTEKRQ